MSFAGRSWPDLRPPQDDLATSERLCLQPAMATLAVVGVVAGIVEGVALVGSRLWYSPDAAQYITLAVAISERLDFTHELSAIRPPGYPLMLAAVFKLFGDSSPTALMALQHGLVVATAVLAAGIAWMLRPSKSFTLTVGILGAFSLHLSGYANAILAEVPYTFLVTVCVYLLVRYHFAGRWRWLLCASLAAGCATLVKPIGQIMLGICALVALHHTWRSLAGTQGASTRPRLRSSLTALACAVVPGATLLVPVMIQNLHNQGRFQFNCMGGLAVYKRAVVVDKLDSAHSQAMSAVRNAYEQAGATGVIDPAIPLDSFAGGWAALEACQAVYGLSYADAADLMGRAGAEILRQHPRRAFWGGLRHACSIILRPTAGYRMQPCRARDKGMFYDYVAQQVGREDLDRYLPLQSLDTLSSAWPARSARWVMDQVAWRYHQRVERGSPILGLLDTPYEEYVLVFALGLGLALLQHHRAAWALLAMVIAGHILASGFWLGPIPRYKIPVHPLMHVFEGLALLQVARSLAALGRIGLTARFALKPRAPTA